MPIKDSDRKKILKAVSSAFKSSEKDIFVPGKSYINYAGRIYDEKELVNLVDSSLDFWLTSGRYAEKFEKKFADIVGSKFCLLTNSGSSANLLAVSALTSPLLKEKRLKPGDEVITTACGFPTTVNPIIQNNAVPVFVDVELGTYNIDISKLKAALSKKTKAIFVAHTLGNPANIAVIKKFAKDNNIWYLEDNCDALGSSYKGTNTGTFGDISTFSFYPAHHMSCSGNTSIPYINEKDQMKIESIESIYNKYVGDPLSIKIISFDKKNKVKWNVPTGILRHKLENKKMVKIICQHGREVNVTEDHSVFVLDKETAMITPRAAAQIKHDDYLVATNDIPLPKNIGHIDILEHFKKKDSYVSNFQPSNLKYVKNTDYKWQFKSRNSLPIKFLIDYDPNKDMLFVGILQSKKIPARILINKEICRLIGYFIAEGSYQNGLILSLHKNETDIIKDIQHISLNLFNVIPSISKVGKNGVNIEIQSKNLEILFREIFDIKGSAYSKRIPWQIFHSERDCINSFIYGYTRGDGSIKKLKDNTNRIDVTSVSKDLLNDFQYLLSMVGISASFYRRNKSSKKKIGNVLTQSKDNFSLSFSGYSYKNLSIVDQNLKNRNDLSDQIPLLPIFRKYISVNKKQKTISKKRLIKHLGSNKRLRSLVSGDTCFLRVRNIQNIPYKNTDYVYDISVPNNENFYGGFLGLFLHNTMGEGGALVTNNALLKRIIMSFRDWGRDCWCDPGRDNTCGKRFIQKFGDLPVGYDHKYVYSHIGYNLKVTDMQAAIGLAQLDKLPRFIEARKKNFATLTSHLSSHGYERYLILPKASKDSEPSWFGYPITVRHNPYFNRADIVKFLEDHKIATRMLFGGNMTKQPAYKDTKFRIVGNLNNTDIVMNDLFWIGVYPGITKEKMDYVLKTFDNFFKGLK